MNKAAIDRMLTSTSHEKGEEQVISLDRIIAEQKGLQFINPVQRYTFLRLLTDKQVLSSACMNIKSLPQQSIASLLELLKEKADIGESKYYFSRVATAIFHGLIQAGSFDGFCEEVQNRSFKHLEGMANVVLIGSPFVHDEAATGLYRIASFLSLFGIRVHVLDNPQEQESCPDLPFYPHIIGKRFLTATFQADVDILNRFEKTYPDSIYIAGGHEASVSNRVFNLIPRLAGSIMSWGEFTLLDIIMNINVEGHSIVTDQGQSFFQGINGIRLKDRELKRKKPFSQPEFRVITQAFNPRLVRDCAGPVKVVNVHGSSHCIQKCIFCMAGTVIRQSVDCPQKLLHIDPSDLLAIARRTQKYLPDTRIINFTDDDFLSNSQLVTGILNMIEANNLYKHFSFFIETRLDSLDNTSKEVLKKMSRLGFARIIIGLESPFKKIAEDLGKGAGMIKRMPYYREILLKAKACGIPCISVFIIIHTLNETVDDLLATLRILIDLMVDDGLTTVISTGLSVYPETPLWKMYESREFNTQHTTIFSRDCSANSVSMPTLALPADGESRQLLEYAITEGYVLDRNFSDAARVYAEMAEMVREHIDDLNLRVELESSLLSFYRIHAAVFSVSRLLLSRRQNALDLIDYLSAKRDEWFTRLTELDI
jgi:hypothetical protein